MKKNLKFILLIVTSMMLTYSLTSCSDNDGYSLNDLYGSLVKVHKDGEGHAQSFTLDNGQTMYVAATATSYKPKNERAIISYTILGDNYQGYDHAIKLNGYFEDVLTKPIIYIPEDDKVKQDSIGYDKIKVFAIWAKGDYINIRFGYNMGGKDQHMLNLVAVNEDKVQQGDEPIKLQFRHNKHQDLEDYASGDMHVSFKLDDYIAANRGNEKLAFEVSWVQYDGVEKKEVLKYPLSPAVVNPPTVDVE